MKAALLLVTLALFTERVAAIGGTTCSFDIDGSDVNCPIPNPNDVWRVGTGMTPTGGTGPTGGEDSPGYLYFEATALPDGGAADIIFPAPGLNGEVCMDFYFHLFGSGIGQLTLFTRPDATSLSTTVVWERCGERGNFWIKKALTMNLTPSTVVGFTGVRGGFQGDIGVDSVSITKGACDQGYTGVYSCDFLPTLDCDYDNRADFKWRELNTSTPTFRTGPSAGFMDSPGFCYTEATGRNPDDAFSLLTAPIEATGDVCVAFAYHMFGIQMGTLEVNVEYGAVSTNIFTISGNQGDQWFPAEFNVSIPANSFAVNFTGIRGPGITSDVAIDAIVVTPRPCGVDPTPPVVSPCDYACDFAPSTTCDFTNEGNASWTMMVGNTPTNATGPHKGFHYVPGYLFVEADGLAQGDVARFRSRTIPGSGYVCVAFAYNMYGLDVGCLEMAVEYEGGRVHGTRVCGPQGPVWYKAEIDVTVPFHKREFTVVFDAKRGSGNRADIAIDAVCVTLGRCSGYVDGSEFALTVAEDNVVKTTAAPATLRCKLETPLTDCGSVHMAWCYPNGSFIPPNLPGFEHSTFYSFDPPFYFNNLVVSSDDPADSGDYACLAKTWNRHAKIVVSLTIPQ